MPRRPAALPTRLRLRRALARTPLLIAAAIALPALAACSLPGSAPGATADPGDPGSGFPLTVDNCGTEVTFDRAPRSVVTIKSTSTELLLALGLGDRIVGSAFSDGPVPERWADAARGVPELSAQVPGEEAVLEAEPELVFAGWESNFSADGAGERDALERLGVRTYVSPAACKEEGYQPQRLAFDDVFADIEEAAAIFDVDPSDLLAEQRATLDAIRPDDRGLDALWYSSGSDTPYVGAGIGAPQLVLDTIGLDNVAADVDDTWAPLGWESVVDRDPDVIVLVDAAWNTAEQKIRLLRSNPATASLDAVVNDRYLTVPFAASEAGVRSVDAAADLAAQLAALEVDG